MKSRISLSFTLALTLSTVSVLIVTLSMMSLFAQASDPIMGSWNLNAAKSKFDPGPAPQSQVFKQEPWEGGLKQTFDTVFADGRRFHSETIAKFDGELRSGLAYRRIDDRTIEWVNKTEDGNITRTNRIVVSHDGKTMTQTTTSATVNNLIVRERQ